MTTKIIGIQASGVATTTDGTTPMAICSFSIPSGMAVKIRAHMVGVQGVNSAGASAEFAAFNNSGAAALVGTIFNLLTMANGSSAALTTAAMTFSYSGSTVTLNVTGVAATTINWFGYMELVGYVP